MKTIFLLVADRYAPELTKKLKVNILHGSQTTYALGLIEKVGLLKPLPVYYDLADN